MKILIVGLGSMGKRRARLTKGIDSSIRIAGVDTAESRRVEATDLGLIDTAYPSIAEAVAAEAPDAALVCTAPLTHAAIISELLDNSLPVFTELNLVADGYEENMAKAKEKGVNLVLAVDAKIADDFSNDAKTDFAPVDQIPDGWEGLDIGPKTEAIYADVIKNSKTILWNGPTGVFEFENFTHGSRTVGEAIVEATKNGAFSLVGGGDSVACVNKFGLANGVSYVSTGGGALLEAIEGKVLPGIAAVKGEAYK